MVDSAVSRNITLPEPEVDGLLADVPGGETNLIPVALTHDDLKVWFTVPPNSDPSLSMETVDLFVDYVDDTSVPIAKRQWTAPIQDSDRFVWLPKAWLGNERNEGRHSLSYRFTGYNGEPDHSADLVFTLDITAPVVPTGSKAVFPPAVLPPYKLTAHYLDLNDDEVEVSLPDYATPRPGDRITWFWGGTPGNQDEGGGVELDKENYLDPVAFTIAGDLIRERKDGLRYVWYEVHDRAGNRSRPSDAVELDVAATPIPRTLPWPSVEKAAGTGQQQTLDPLQAVAGGIVQVPDDAVIYPQERVFVQWGEPETLGGRRVNQPIIPGQHRYQIDMPAVAAHIGKTLSVSYGVIDARGVEHPSIARRLSVQTIPSNRFEAVRCDGLSGGNLSYQNVEAAGARLTLARWSMITTDQWIMITMTGVNASGQDSVFEAVRKRAVTEQETLAGIGFRTEVRVSRAFLNGLRRNAPLTGKVYVSFDGGQTWPPLSAPNFPLLQLTFIN